MALKDGPSPKCVFLIATAAAGVTTAAATAAAAALAAAAAPGSKTPRLLLWLLLQLPAAKHHGPKTYILDLVRPLGPWESKIYVLRSERPF